MKLDDAQKKKVAQWIEEGLKLGDIQKKLDQEFKISMTYMEVRFLVDDLKLMPKDPAPPPAPPKTPDKAAPAASPAPAAGTQPLPDEEDELLPEPPFSGGSGKVSVTVDTLTRPGALVSGNVTFSDGQSAVWYLDQMGRLGLAAKQTGYRPSAADLQEFQMELQTEMQKLGM